MEQYNVTGMSCAACSARVEKAVNAVNGVTSCSVSLLTNSMGVEGNASSKDIIDAVVKAGYGASLKGAKSNNSSNEDELKDTETPKLKRRLFISLFFLLILMYFSMGHMMFNWPIPSFMVGNHVAMGILEMLLTIIVMIINQKFFVSGFKGILHKAPNMDTLVALGASASFIYSVYALFAMTSAQVNNDMDLVMYYMDQFYFESAAMILTLITVGKTLEAYSKGRTTDALKGLMKLKAKTAVILRNNQEIEVPIEEVHMHDIFVVKPGENIPVDGKIIKGSSAINESALTGESIPVDKEVGDEVFAATLNTSGYIECEALKVGEDTTLSQIIQMVSDVAATKAPIAKIADKVSGVFVPVVISIATITFIIWMIVKGDFGFALARAISVLVISCPCSLGLATPVAIMVGNGMGAKNGILFKNASALEHAGKVTIVALDKTGTITKGEPVVTDIESDNKEYLLQVAYSLEKQSEHPLAKAIVKKSEELDIKSLEISDFKALSGNGLSAILNDKHIYGGSLKYISNLIHLDPTIINLANTYAEQGKTPLFFIEDHTFLGMIVVADILKEDSIEAIKQLKNMGIHTVMLTGDNKKTANAIAAQAGVDEVIADVLPQGKESVVRSLMKKGKVAMVGDGINDTPALTRADIGIAIGAGSDIAIDAAEIVLMKSNLLDVPAAIRLSRQTLKNIHENLFWAFFYNSIGIPVAAGCFIALFGWQLNPMLAAGCMSLSSFCVVTNALRLNLFKIYNASKDKKIKIKQVKVEEEKEMKKTLKIEGMMCPHCEAAVKKALEAIDGVEEAVVSHEAGTAIVSLSSDVNNDILKDAVEAKDYKVLDVE